MVFKGTTGVYELIREFETDFKKSFPNVLILTSLVWKTKYKFRNQPPVVQKMDSTIYRINQYPAEKYYRNQLRYPLDKQWVALSSFWTTRAWSQNGCGKWHFFWSEIGSGFGGLGGTPTQRIPRGIFPDWKLLISKNNLHLTVNVAMPWRQQWPHPSVITLLDS